MPLLENYDKKLLEVEREIERQKQSFALLNQKIEAFFEELGMTKEEYLAYVSDPIHFSEEEWALMEKLRVEHEEKESSVSPLSLSSTRKTSLARSSLKEIRHNWIPI